MALSTEEVLAGLAELINDETGIATDSVELGKSFTDDLDIDSISNDDHRRQRRREVRGENPRRRGQESQDRR